MSKNGYTCTWTPERVEKMTQLWSEGYSAGMIAKELGGFPDSPDAGRNATIGKLYRMGMVGTEKPRHTMPRGTGSAWRKLWPLRNAPPRIKRVAVAKAFPAGMASAEPPAAPQSLLKSLLDLQGGECKWPSGDGPYMFCGHPVESGSYCPWHRSIAFTKGTQKDVDRVASRCLGGKLHASKTFVLEA